MFPVTPCLLFLFISLQLFYYFYMQIFKFELLLLGIRNLSYDVIFHKYKLVYHLTFKKCEHLLINLKMLSENVLDLFV